MQTRKNKTTSINSKTTTENIDKLFSNVEVKPSQQQDDEVIEKNIIKHIEQSLPTKEPPNRH